MVVVQDLPITDASKRATPLSPAAWKDMLRFARPISPAAQSESGCAAALPTDSMCCSQTLNMSWLISLIGDNSTPTLDEANFPMNGSCNCACIGLFRHGPWTMSAGRAATNVAGTNETRSSKGSWRSLGDTPRHSPPAPAAVDTTLDAAQAPSPDTGSSTTSDGDTARALSSVGHSGSGSSGSRDAGHKDNSEGCSSSSHGREDNVTAGAAALRSQNNNDVVVLDVRNGYEWDAGHFQGSARPQEVKGAGGKSALCLYV